MFFDVVIVGAGPGGLACAEITASKGLTTLVLERKQTLGKKVCAGGITWNGLLKKVPKEISEKQFPDQYIFTRHQKTCVSSPTPIIATVNREHLGQQMAHNARTAGAEIRLGCQVISINNDSISYLDKSIKKSKQVTFSYLVGADGSSSFVRRHLGLPSVDIGVGINFQLPVDYQEMQWHLDSSLFGSGYAWIFPHKETVSVGAYADSRVMKAKVLKKNLISWGEKFGFQLSLYKGQAEFINFDYRGYRFNNVFLIGDAAGLASGLTGEGIYPAIISGEAVAALIAKPGFNPLELERLIKNHGRHRIMVSIAGKNAFLSTVLAELATFCLKKKLIDFSAVEMAH